MKRKLCCFVVLCLISVCMFAEARTCKIAPNQMEVCWATASQISLRDALLTLIPKARYSRDSLGISNIQREKTANKLSGLFHFAGGMHDPQVNPELAAAVSFRESSLRARVQGLAGEGGLMQIMPNSSILNIKHALRLTGSRSPKRYSKEFYNWVADPKISIFLGVGKMASTRAEFYKRWPNGDEWDSVAFNQWLDIQHAQMTEKRIKRKAKWIPKRWDNDWVQKMYRKDSTLFPKDHRWHANQLKFFTQYPSMWKYRWISAYNWGFKIFASSEYNRAIGYPMRVLRTMLDIKQYMK